MTFERIRGFASTYNFKTDGPLKQQVLLDYLLEIKFQLREEEKISGRCWINLFIKLTIHSAKHKEWSKRKLLTIHARCYQSALNEITIISMI